MQEATKFGSKSNHGTSQHRQESDGADKNLDKFSLKDMTEITSKDDDNHAEDNLSSFGRYINQDISSDNGSHHDPQAFFLKTRQKHNKAYVD